MSSQVAGSHQRLPPTSSRRLTKHASWRHASKASLLAQAPTAPLDETHARAITSEPTTSDGAAVASFSSV